MFHCSFSDYTFLLNDDLKFLNTFFAYFYHISNYNSEEFLLFSQGKEKNTIRISIQN